MNSYRLFKKIEKNTTEEINLKLKRAKTLYKFIKKYINKYILIRVLVLLKLFEFSLKKRHAKRKINNLKKKV